jgi:hypothetical protein
LSIGVYGLGLCVECSFMASNTMKGLFFNWVMGKIAEGYLSPNTNVGGEMRRYGMRGRKQ